MRINWSLHYQNCFASPDGQAVLEQLRELFNPLTATALPVGNDGHVDALDMARREGQRSVICMINRMMKQNIHEDRQEHADNG